MRCILIISQRVATRLIELARLALAGGDSPSSPAQSTLELARKHNLPATTTSLIGREDDAQALQQLVKRTDVRLMTLIGAPGVGKTRLALQVGWNALNDFADGVWFVPLAAVDEPKHIAETILHALELQSANLSPQIALRNHLREKTPSARAGQL